MSAQRRYRSVKLRCAKCRRPHGTAENGIRRYYVLDIPDAHLNGPETTQTHTALQCRCGAQPRLNIDDACAAAERAYALGTDLFVGAPDYGLPRQRDTLSSAN